MCEEEIKLRIIDVISGFSSNIGSMTFMSFGNEFVL